MRQNPNQKRGRNRSNGRRSYGNSPNRSFDSNGPDVKVRGTAPNVAEKYQALSRDASVSGDRIAAENYLQHAEHYIRIVAQNQAATLERQQQQERERADRAGQRRPRRGDGEDQPDEVAEAGDVEATVEADTAKDTAEGPAGDDSEDRAA